MKAKNNHVSIINRGSKVEGSLIYQGHLIIEGTVQGTIQGDTVYAEKDSHITASLQAKSLYIAGFFEGNVLVTDTLTLLKTAQVKGQIRCHKLIIEAGAILNGNVKFDIPMKDQEPPSLPGKDSREVEG